MARIRPLFPTPRKHHPLRAHMAWLPPTTDELACSGRGELGGIAVRILFFIFFFFSLSIYMPQPLFPIARTHREEPPTSTKSLSLTKPPFHIYTNNTLRALRYTKLTRTHSFTWPLDYCREGSEVPESDYNHVSDYFISLT